MAKLVLIWLRASESGSSCWLWIYLDNVEFIAEGMRKDGDDEIYKNGNDCEGSRSRG